MNDNFLLQFENITKGFPGVQALENVNLSIMTGEVHAIVGENGAGKSTLMKIAAGLYQPDSGKIFLGGQAVNFKQANEALRHGIAIIPQELNLVSELTVAENIFLNMEPRGFIGMVDNRQLQYKANEVLASLGVGIDIQKKVKNLTVAQQQMVQIARATAFQCKVLIMDEPTASLSYRETISLFGKIKYFREQGTTILYISHRLKEVFEIADRITVLRDGKLMQTMDVKDATEDKIVNLMIGRSIYEAAQKGKKDHKNEDIVLEGRGLTRIGHFENINFRLHKGEILGFAGLVGAGRSEVFSSVFGYPKLDKGELFVRGSKATISSPIEAINLGIGYVPEERKRLGLFLIMSVLHNTTLPFIKRFQKFLILQNKKEQEEANRLKEQLKVSTPSMNHNIENLSGGNQQKVILARWLGSGAEILILDEPTRGIDINAKAEIHSLITVMANNDKSIILISSELQELMNIADRIIVMREGHIVGEADPKQTTEEEILRMAMWGTDSSSIPPWVAASDPASAI